MTLGENNRYESFKALLLSGEIGQMQKVVLELFYLNPNTTSQFIAERGNLPLATVNGRRNELMERGLITSTGTNNTESSKGRTTYAVSETLDLKAKESVSGCLSYSQMKGIGKDLQKIRNIIHKPSVFQKAKIIHDLKLTLELYQGDMKIGDKL